MYINVRTFLGKLQLSMLVVGTRADYVFNMDGLRVGG